MLVLVSLLFLLLDLFGFSFVFCRSLIIFGEPPGSVVASNFFKIVWLELELVVIVDEIICFSVENTGIKIDENTKIGWRITGCGKFRPLTGEWVDGNFLAADVSGLLWTLFWKSFSGWLEVLNSSPFFLYRLNKTILI